MVEPGKPRASKKGRKERSRGFIMEDEIWKEFPEELFEAVIARVPIATFFRFRSVCGKWNSLLTSQSFSQQCAQVKHANPWFYAITNENVHTGAMYDPSSSKWHHPTVPALPTIPFLLPVASAGGLICFNDDDRRSFCVCNPLTRSFRELPARSVKRVWSCVAVGMITQNGGYKILWVGSEGDYQVFDSANNSWIRPGRMPPSIKLPLGLNFVTSRAVAVEGRLYFMRSDPDGLLSYEVDNGIWIQYAIPVPPHMSVSGHRVAESGGRIMLVGMLTENEATRVCVWELQKMSLLWKEVDRMPNIWCLEFYGRHVTMTCLGKKALLMLSLRSEQMNWLFTYDLSTREWLKIPDCVRPHTWTRKSHWIACGTAFYPCLTAIP